MTKAKATAPDPRFEITLDVRDFVIMAVGFGCLIGFARMTSLGFIGYLNGSVASSGDDWYGLRAAASLAMLAALALNGWFSRFKVGLPAVVGATVAAIAGVILFAVDPSGAFGPLVAVLVGASTSVLMYVWLLLLCPCGKGDLVAVSIVGLVISGAIVMGVPLIDDAVALIVSVASAFCAGFGALLSDHSLERCKPDGRLSREQAAEVPWFSVIALATSGFVATVVYGISEHLTGLYDWQPNYIVFGVAATSAIAATYGMLLTLDTWKDAIWSPQMLIVVLALALSCFSLRESMQGAVGFMLASVFCAHFLHWVVFPAMLGEANAPRAFVASILLILVNGSLATMTGDALGSMLPHSMQNLGGVAGLSVIALVVILAAAQAALRVLMPKQAPSGNEAPPERTTLESRIEAYAAEYGLTPRESEVALLTAQGFSCAYIAEKLVVSNSTVRFHQQNLYRKVDVHSRNEFIELATSGE